MNTKLNADESAAFMAGRLRRQEPFSFWRFGDGFIELMLGKKGQTCDGEQYSEQLAADMMACWQALDGPNVYLGDWQSASFSGASDKGRYEADYRDLIADRKVNWLHFEALLLMRESAALADFYRAVKEDPRRKLFMGPRSNFGAAEKLGCSCIGTPMNGLHVNAARLSDMLHSVPFDILLFGAGMAGNIPAIKCWQQYQERTYINLGSALDIVGRGRSRKQQISRERALAVLGMK